MLYDGSTTSFNLLRRRSVSLSSSSQLMPIQSITNDDDQRVHIIGLSHNLASYFGDQDAVPNSGKCGHCTYCLTKTATSFTRLTIQQLDHARIQRVLEACKDRDDPRLLTRLAFGITSPRLTTAKLTRNPVFGSMVDCDWVAMLKEFTKICDAEGNQPAQPSSPAKKAGSTKRAHSGGGRGGGVKRGRY